MRNPAMDRRVRAENKKDGGNQRRLQLSTQHSALILAGDDVPGEFPQ